MNWLETGEGGAPGRGRSEHGPKYPLPGGVCRVFQVKTTMRRRGRKSGFFLLFQRYLKQADGQAVEEPCSRSWCTAHVSPDRRLAVTIGGQQLRPRDAEIR